MDLNELREALKTLPISTISRFSGVTRPTIMAIRDGKTDNPGIKTVDLIKCAIGKLRAERRKKHHPKKGVAA